MKTTIKAILTITTVVASASASFAQATASCSANITTPISIVKTVDMSFGNIAVSATAGGTAILTPAGTRSTSGAGGVVLPANTGMVAAAIFTVSGQPNFTYAITLPSSCTLSDGASHSMNVNAFNSLPSYTGTLGTSGSQTIRVGASLNIPAGQAPDIYTNATAIPVTVNYN